jgi:hypothetical protein
VLCCCVMNSLIKTVPIYRDKIMIFSIPANKKGTGSRYALRTTDNYRW